MVPRYTFAVVIGVVASFLLSICNAGEDIDLRDISTSSGSFKIAGASAGQNIGKSVSSAGDFNSDGYMDLIVGSFEAGATYVIFGGPSAQNVDLFDFRAGGSGFNITGGNGDNAGTSVSGGGDFNGDGIDDIIVGAPGSANGTAYVLYGQNHSTTTFSSVYLPSFSSGTAGVVIHGPVVDSSCGEIVSNAGDVNGDGVADFLVWTTDAVYIIFGSSTNNVDIHLHDFHTGAEGFKVSTTDNSNFASGVGDVNNDGYADIIVSTDSFYLVYGGANIASDILVDSNFISGESGFKINGSFAGDDLSANNAGDVNADGIQDLIVSIPSQDDADPVAFVIFGQTTANSVDVDLTTFNADGGKGFKMIGFGGKIMVSGAGDVNADGIDDVIVLCPPAQGFLYGAGTSFVLFGRNHNTSSFDDMDLSRFNSGGTGVRILGSAAADDVGYYAVSSVGDMNGDGYADVVIGSTAVKAYGREESGAAYVVDGQSITHSSTYNKKKTVDGGRIGALVGGIGGLLLIMGILIHVKYGGSGYRRTPTIDSPPAGTTTTDVVPV